MFKRLFRIKRYFIVSYNFKSGHGQTEVHVTEGSFFNKLIFCSKIETLIENKVVDTGNIVISSILEVNKKDYEDFIRI